MEKKNTLIDKELCTIFTIGCGENGNKDVFFIKSFIFEFFTETKVTDESPR